MKRALRLLAVVVAAPLLSGCFFFPPVGLDGSGSAQSTAQASVRSAIPAIEAYYADNGTYAGMTLEHLQQVYDRGIQGVRLVGSPSQETYCVESAVGETTYSKRGPRGEIIEAAC